MDDTEQEPRAPDVMFGPHHSDRLPHEWASRGLTWLKEHRPQVFADMMTEGVFGIDRARRNTRRG